MVALAFLWDVSHVSKLNVMRLDLRHNTGIIASKRPFDGEGCPQRK